MRAVRSGGGWAAIRYAWDVAQRVGGIRRLYGALRSRNACKTCALGMGGQRGGMVDERGSFPQVCKKSMQAMASDMQPAIPADFWRRCGFAELQRMSSRELEHAGRLVEPLYSGPDDAGYRPVSWEEALHFCIERLRGTRPDENFFYFSGRASNEAGFVAQLFARLYGTNHVNNCSYYCHQASAVGLSSALGTGTSTVMLEDLHRCDTLFLLGGNPASNHPRFLSLLVRLRRRGGTVVVINPLRETGLVRFRVPSDPRSLLLGSKIASLYVQPHIGGDIALLVGVAKRLDELGPRHLDQEFIRRHTEGFEDFVAHVRRTPWDQIVRSSGVERETIERLARIYAESRAAIFAWTMGITHHVHGVDNVRAIVNLALLRGMVGRPHAGLLPIRGHSNVQGIGSMGVTPRLRQAVLDRLESHFGVRLPDTPGLHTLGCILAMEEGRLRNGWCIGGNLFGCNPDSARTAEAFGRLEAVVYFSTTLNTGHAWGRARHTLILPVRARDEEPQPTTQESMFNYVRLSDGGPARLEGPRSEVELLATIAQGVLGDGGPVNWAALREHRNIRRLIAEIVPGYEPVGQIDQTRREFHVGGRILHEPRFPTASGRARFHVVRLPESPPPEAGPAARSAGAPEGPACGPLGPLRLMTLRSEGQFNTVVYEEHDLYRHQSRRDVILLSAADMERWGLRVDQPVIVRSAVGQMRGIRVRPFDIRAGNAAMYYPEANVLVPREADPESHTPAFKSVWVMLEPDTSSVPVELTVEVPRRRRGAAGRLAAC